MTKEKPNPLAKRFINEVLLREIQKEEHRLDLDEVDLSGLLQQFLSEEAEPQAELDLELGLLIGVFKELTARINTGPHMSPEEGQNVETLARALVFVSKTLQQRFDLRQRSKM